MKSLLIRLIKKLGDMRRHLLYYRIWPAVYGRAAKKPRFSGAGCMKICFSINNSFGMA